LWKYESFLISLFFIATYSSEMKAIINKV